MAHPRDSHAGRRVALAAADEALGSADWGRARDEGSLPFADSELAERTELFAPADRWLAAEALDGI